MQRAFTALRILASVLPCHSVLQGDGANKPRLLRLINQEWKTRAQIESDAQGQAKFRGFFGKYQVAVTSGERIRCFEINHTSKGSRRHEFALEP